MLVLRACVVLPLALGVAAAFNPAEYREQLRSSGKIVFGHHASPLARRSVETSELAGLVINTAVISVGTPAQKFDAIIDTGSMDMWFQSTSMPFPSAGIALYDDSKSSTYQAGNTTSVTLTYGDDTAVTGFAVKDVVVVDDSTMPGFTFMKVGAYKRATTNNAAYPAMMGLSLPINEASSPRVRAVAQMGTTVTAQFLKVNITSFSYQSGLNGAKGKITFGAAGKDQDSASAVRIPLSQLSQPISDVMWTVNITGAAYGAVSSGLNTVAILDTGTSLTFLPDPVVHAIGMATGGKVIPAPRGVSAAQWPAVYSFDCSAAKTNKDLILTINNQTLSIPAAVYIHNPLKDVANTNHCILGIMGTGSNEPAGIMGMNLLRAFYTTWSWTTREVAFSPIAFAAAVPGGAPASSSGSGSPSSTSPAPAKSSAVSSQKTGVIIALVAFVGAAFAL
ncbi:Vacuolar protease A [Geranomyces variabilis]|nr:Vacuolar protease A [Geranomyces variabilis]